MSPKPLPQAKRRRKHVEAYDFKQPKLFSKEIMRSLRLLHEVFARNLSRVFASALRQKVDVKLLRIDQLSGSEFIRQIESPAAIYLVTVNGLGGDLVLVMNPGFCIHMVERQSGGKGSDLRERRMLTTIEEKIMNRIMRAVNKEIVDAWEPIAPFSIKSMAYESKADNVHMVSTDPAIVIVFQLDLESDTIPFWISYPYSLLKESLNDSVLQSASHSSKVKLNEEQMQAYEQTLRSVLVRMQPLLGNTRLSLYDLTRLQVGDAISLTQKTKDPLEVRVNGVKKFVAYPGILGTRKAIKIFDVIDEINEQELL